MSEACDIVAENSPVLKKARPIAETILIEDDEAATKKARHCAEKIVIEDDHPSDVAPAVQQTSTITGCPITTKTPAAKETPVLSRSTRAIPATSAKVVKSTPKKTVLNKVATDKAAQLRQILESKTQEAKIEKPGLTPEEIDEDLIAMGILPAVDHESQARPEKTSGSSSSNSPGVNEVGADASGIHDPAV